MTAGVADKDLLDKLVRLGGGIEILERPLVKQVELARERVYKMLTFGHFPKVALTSLTL